jgi:hypothetical protein
VDLAELLETQGSGTVNGVIYGTRSFNYDRIIGKYTYTLSKSQAETAAVAK